MVMSGDNIGRYQLLNILGRGGFATVFRALDTALDREVALKVLGSHLAEDERYRTRFLSEARLMARMRQPNVVTVYDVGEEGDRPYFAMELIEGDTLEKLLAYGEQLSPEQTLAILRDLAGAIDYLHAAGVVHRDVKAANVMLDPSGRAVLMDFGIARMLDDAQLTASGAVMGTPEAMAPEQARGEPVGTQSDIYALGVLAYRMLAGRPPFVGNTAAVLHGHAFDDPVSLRVLRPGLPGKFYAAVTSALAKDPVHRPRTAATFVNSLERALDPAPTEPEAAQRFSGALPPAAPEPSRPMQPMTRDPADEPTLFGPPAGSYDETVFTAPTVLSDVTPTRGTPLASPAAALPPKAHRGRLPFIAAAVAAVLIAGGILAFVLTRASPAAAPTPTAAIAAASPTPARGGQTAATATAAGTGTAGASGTVPAQAAATTASPTGTQATAPPAAAAPTTAPPAASGPLGDLDLAAYCQRTGGTLRLQADNSWACHNADNSVTRLDLNDACRKQYGRDDTIAQQKPESDPPSFRCLPSGG